DLPLYNRGPRRTIVGCREYAERRSIPICPARCCSPRLSTCCLPGPSCGGCARYGRSTRRQKLNLVNEGGGAVAIEHASWQSPGPGDIWLRANWAQDLAAVIHGVEFNH